MKSIHHVLPKCRAVLGSRRVVGCPTVSNFQRISSLLDMAPSRRHQSSAAHEERRIYGSLTERQGHQNLPQPGDFAELYRTFTLKDVQTFSVVSGDDNPLHIDSEFAKDSRFGKPIVHGILCASLFSTIFGSQIPGSVYLSQELKFATPVYVDEQICARITVESVRERIRVLHCKTECLKADGSLAVTGKANVLLPGSRVTIKWPKSCPSSAAF